MQFTDNVTEPTNYCNQWEEAMVKEFTSLSESETFEFVDKPKDKDV